MRTKPVSRMTRNEIKAAWLANHPEIKAAFRKAGFFGGWIDRLGLDLYCGKYPSELPYIETPEHLALLETLLAK